MARQAKVSSVTGLTRVEAIKKIHSVGVKFDPKANSKRVEAKYTQLFDKNGNLKTIPATKVATVKTPRKPRTPKGDKLPTYYGTENGKKVKVSPYTGLTYSEQRKAIKELDPSFKGRSHASIDDAFITLQYNRANPDRPIQKASELPLQPISESLAEKYDQLRKFSKFSSSENSPVVNASVDNIRLVYKTNDAKAFLESSVYKLILRTMGDEYPVSDKDVRAIIDILPLISDKTMTSGAISDDKQYQQIVRGYFRDKEKRENNNKKAGIQ